MIPLPAQWTPECWSPTYFRDRFLSVLYQQLHPRAPWLNRHANRRILPILTPTHHILEFGGGRSTRYFARHCAHVTTIEHDPDWHQQIKTWLQKDQTYPKVDLRLVPPPHYAHAADDTPEAHFDLVLIDGRHRAHCTQQALPKLKPNGLLIIDNINRHIPCQSPGPGTLQTWDDANPEHQLWQNLQHRLSNWPQTWTSDGVTDTLLLTKPTQT